ncbi:hypothetical protein [Borrelia sp. RT1S]|uniref:hypothetical protein n=1 Tax=Borrelia sp. RT1S TaxID=2898580 RepID=UPI001E362234|nr:hypothetical protein [Borrelia sp. RT1S]UGQ17613.1 hypothetical protein LSO05_04390 [Borrelia sp. RT1S]
MQIRAIVKTTCLLLVVSCTTVEFQKEYETKFDIVESTEDYISVDIPRATDEYVCIQITNKSHEIVKINWQNTSLNSKNIVTTENDLILMNKLDQYNKKYKEFFIGPETSQKFTIYLLDSPNENTQISANKTEKHNYSFNKIKYPAILKLSIVKAYVDTTKPINILISRIPKLPLSIKR